MRLARSVAAAAPGRDAAGDGDVFKALADSTVKDEVREGRYKFHYIDTGLLQRLTDRWRNRETKEH